MLSVFKSKNDEGFAGPKKEGIEPFESIFDNSTSYYTNINPDNLEEMLVNFLE